MTTTLKDLAKTRQEYFDKAKAAGKEAVLEAAKDVFAAHPQVKRLSWTQYTPYFNDGEPCEFDVHDVYANGAEVVDERWDEDSETNLSVYDYSTGYGAKAKVLLPAVVEFDKLIHANQELMQMLGEGKVVVTRSSIEVEEFDHD